jgi:hypothetical protein
MNDDTDNTDPTADLVDALQYSDGETAGQKLHEFLNTRDVAKAAIDRRHQQENPEWEAISAAVRASMLRLQAEDLVAAKVIDEKTLSELGPNNGDQIANLHLLARAEGRPVRSCQQLLEDSANRIGL